MAGLRPKQAKRRLKIEELQGKGFTFRQIATRLKVSLKTVERDIAQLNDERDYMTPYVEERLKIRAEIDQRHREGLQRIVEDWLEARKDTIRTERTTRPAKMEVKRGQPSFDFLQVLKQIHGEEKALEIFDAFGLVVVETKVEQLSGPNGENLGPAELLEKLRHIEVTETIFGPDWKAVAAIQRSYIAGLKAWAEFHGLITHQAHVTTTSAEERVIEGQIVLPEKASPELWEAIVTAHKEGRKVGVLPSGEVTALAAQGVGLLEWNPEAGKFVPVEGTNEKPKGE